MWEKLVHAVVLAGYIYKYNLPAKSQPTNDFGLSFCVSLKISNKKQHRVVWKCVNYGGFWGRIQHFAPTKLMTWACIPPFLLEVRGKPYNPE